MQILQAGERKEFTLSHMKVKGFGVNVKLKHTTIDSSNTSADVDFSKAQLKVILKRDKQQFIIIQDDLKALGLESNLYTFARRAFYQDHAWRLYLNVTAGTPFETLLAFDIDFGGTLDLRGTDELLVELDCRSEMFASNINTSQSFIEIKETQSLGFEKYVPYIRTYGIQANERRRTFDLGNNVTGMVLLNYDKALLTAPVLSTLTLSSKQLDQTMSFLDLVNQRYSNLPDQGGDPSSNVNAADEFEQCFVIAQGVELDNVKLDIQFNSANVTGNNNILLVKSCYTDVKTLIEHDARVIQAQNEKIAELKQNGQNATL